MRRFISIAGAVALTAAVGAPAAATPASEDDTAGLHKVVVCHATNSYTNPYVVIEVDIASAGGLSKVMGHYDHVTPHKKGWGDWIEGFVYEGVPYPAQGEPVSEDAMQRGVVVPDACVHDGGGSN